jgi:hypothetical protein
MSTHFVKRVWIPSDSSDSWKQWTLGNEVWDLKNDVLEHFCIHKRSFEGNELHEILIRLPDTPVPAEARYLPSAGLGWSVSEVKEKIKKPKHDEVSVTSDVSNVSNVRVISQERWTSLSHWIPPSALYQPSLHHEALLELSDKSIHIVISKKLPKKQNASKNGL